MLAVQLCHGFDEQLGLYAGEIGEDHRVVFTLVLRITANQETADELTVDVFYDTWRLASSYDAANDTVLGWIMNQSGALTGARSPALR